MVSNNPASLWEHIPAHLRPSIARYLVRGIPPGGFLDAVFRGDLFTASLRADDISIAGLGYVARFVMIFAPPGSKCEFMPGWAGGRQERRDADLADSFECYEDFIDVLIKEAA